MSTKKRKISTLALTLDKKQTETAVKAVLKWLKGQESASKSLDLLDSGSYILLQITLKKSTTKRAIKPIIIPLRHSLHDPELASVCLISRDPQREVKDLLEKQKIYGGTGGGSESLVDKVISVKKVRTQLKGFNQKREFQSSYDVFLADDRIIPLLPKALGKSFFKKKTLPIPVRVSASGEEAEKQIRHAINSTTCVLGTGSCVSVKIAHSAVHSTKQIVENIVTALPHITRALPAGAGVDSGLDMIQALHIKTVDSVALPIFNSL